MNRFPYRDIMMDDDGGDGDYNRKKINDEIGNLLHLKELGCDEIVKRLVKKRKNEKISNT